MLVINSLLAIFLAMPGGTEWIFILLAVVLLFGGKKIPELMKGIGKGVRDFNDAKETVPPALMNFGTGVKRKSHDMYGAHFKAQDGAELKKATKITFDD